LKKFSRAYQVWNSCLPGCKKNTTNPTVCGKPIFTIILLEMMKNIFGSKNIYRITLQNGRMIGFINNGMFDRGNF
jgi:hypothetical protein